MHAWDIPIYPAAEAGRLVKLSPGRVRKWLQGYEYTYKAGTKNEQRSGSKGPIVKRQESHISSYASFLDLVDLVFVKEFIAYGLSLQKIRRALDEAEQLVGGHHFAQRKFFTDGKNIYFEVNNKADALMELLSGGQWVIAPVIKQFAHKVEFDTPTGYVKRWFPLGSSGLVVLDPTMSFGKPTLVNKGIATANVYDFYLAENKNTNKVSKWMGLKEEEVQAAVNFEQQLAA